MPRRSTDNSEPEDKMSLQNFTKVVDAYFAERPSANSADAERALLILYNYIADKAELASHQIASEAGLGYAFLVQQVMTWSPLRLFWEELAQDTHLVIRSAAKGNICEATNRYAFDPEIELIGLVNLAVIMSGIATQLQNEMSNERWFKEAQVLWHASGQGLSFVPEIRVIEFSPEDQE